MLYIKLADDGSPVNHPILGDNLKQVLEVSVLDDETLKTHGYALFEYAPRAANAVSSPTTDYYVDTDGVVRNRVNVREFTQDELLDKFIRTRRSYLLVRSDWTQAPDSPLSEAKKAEWAAYRQALRDLPSSYPNVSSEGEVVWPSEPA